MIAASRMKSRLARLARISLSNMALADLAEQPGAVDDDPHSRGEAGLHDGVLAVDRLGADQHGNEFLRRYMLEDDGLAGGRGGDGALRQKDAGLHVLAADEDVHRAADGEGGVRLVDLEI